MVQKLQRSERFLRHLARQDEQRPIAMRFITQRPKRAIHVPHLQFFRERCTFGLPTSLGIAQYRSCRGTEAATHARESGTTRNSWIIARPTFFAFVGFLKSRFWACHSVHTRMYCMMVLHVNTDPELLAHRRCEYACTDYVHISL